MPVHNTHMVFFSMRQLLNNNKLGNLQRLIVLKMCETHNLSKK